MISIAIDGPAGSGKSTVAKLLAEKLNYVYIDTGAMYRTATYKVIVDKVDFKDKKQLIEAIKNIDISLKGTPSNQRVFLDGNDITSEIRKDDVSKLVSTIAAFKEIREIMVEKQRKIARTNDVVMDGRDIGSHVLKEADYKFYITASLEERARRRKKDFDVLNEDLSLNEIMDRIHKRDEEDQNREHNPLVIADDAQLIDTTLMNIDEVLENIFNIVHNK